MHAGKRAGRVLFLSVSPLTPLRGILRGRTSLALMSLALLATGVVLYLVSRPEVHCSFPVVAGEQPLYGPVEEADLPWFADPPLRLDELKERFGAKKMAVAFRATIPNPLFEEQHNTRTAAEHLAGSVVQPGQVFSVYNVIGPPTKERGYRLGPSYAGGRIVPTLAGGVCKISTAVYNAVIMSDLPVVERHPHSMPVSYVPPGRDATLAWRAKDLRFRNDRDKPIVIWSQVQDRTLYIALYGEFAVPEVEWHSEELSRVPTWTVRESNPQLPSGTERLVIEGYDGVTVRTWVTVTYPSGETEERQLGTDSYRPMPRIVEYGP